VAVIFRKTDRDSLSISNTLKKWRKNFLGNEIVNKPWILVPSFFIWHVWKERKGRIFKNETRRPQHIIEKILRYLKDTIRIL